MYVVLCVYVCVYVCMIIQEHSSPFLSVTANLAALQSGSRGKKVMESIKLSIFFYRYYKEGNHLLNISSSMNL